MPRVGGGGVVGVVVIVVVVARARSDKRTRYARLTTKMISELPVVV
jgi:hypothetical protein